MNNIMFLSQKYYKGRKYNSLYIAFDNNNAIGDSDFDNSIKFTDYFKVANNAYINLPSPLKLEGEIRRNLLCSTGMFR
jgi:hypothetical protein